MSWKLSQHLIGLHVMHLLLKYCAIHRIFACTRLSRIGLTYNCGNKKYSTLGDGITVYVSWVPNLVWALFIQNSNHKICFSMFKSWAPSCSTSSFTLCLQAACLTQYVSIYLKWFCIPELRLSSVCLVYGFNNVTMRRAFRLTFPFLFKEKVILQFKSFSTFDVYNKNFVCRLSMSWKEKPTGPPQSASWWTTMPSRIVSYIGRL